MSYQATGWAVGQTTGAMGAKAVLMTLAHHADEFGYCYPSVATIAKEAETSDDTVQRALRHLVGKELVRVDRRHRDDGSQASNAYWLLMPGLAELPDDHPSLGKLPPRRLRGGGGSTGATGGSHGCGPMNSQRISSSDSSLSSASPQKESAPSKKSPSPSADGVPVQEGSPEWFKIEVWNVVGPRFKERFYPTVSMAEFKKRLGRVIATQRHDLRAVRSAMLSTLKAEPGGDAWQYLAGVLRDPPRAELKLTTSI